MQNIDLICSGTGGSFLSMAGALKALYKNNLQPKRIACTSGSSIPMAFCGGLGYSPEEFLELAVATDFKKLVVTHVWNPFIHSCIFNNKGMGQWIDKESNYAVLGDLKLDTFAVNATDINSGEMVVFSNLNEPSMPLYKALCATTCIPGIFPSLEYKGRYFVDGGVEQNLLAGIFDDKKARLKIAFLEKDEEKCKFDISSKLTQPVVPSDDKRPGILQTATSSIKHLMDALLEAQTRDLQNTIIIQVPAIATDHQFYLTTEEKIGLFAHGFEEVDKMLQEKL
jgi:predicted acylesterase/phospholipase RssA